MIYLTINSIFIYVDRRKNMEEEKVVEQEVVKEEPKAEAAPSNEVQKPALIAMIISIIALAVCPGWIVGGAACTILSLVSVSFQRRTPANLNQPYSTFLKVAKILAIIAFFAGLISVTFYSIKLVVDIVKAINNAASK